MTPWQGEGRHAARGGLPAGLGRGHRSFREAPDAGGSPGKAGRARRAALLAALAVALAQALSACSDADGGAKDEAEERCRPDDPPSRTVSCIEAFEPGEGAGHGADRYPEIVYGEPVGGGERQGSLDVLALGKGGTIVVGFGGNAIADGDGPDFTVFENPFWIGGDPGRPFAELAEVSVSDDGETWATFSCRSEEAPYEGCAGVRPVLAGSSESDASAFDPTESGGDPFDLADLGLTEARFVRIRDLGNPGGGGTAGFDLDAVAIVNPAVAPNE